MIKNQTLNVNINKKKSIYKIGIPRALLFYKFGPIWHDFLTELGQEIIYSPPTSTKIVENGSQNANSELCVPMKIYYGHVLKLVEEYSDLDFIFIPRYVSTHKEQYYCPKFMALPEAVKYSLNLKIPILTLDFNIKENTEQESLSTFAQCLNLPRSLVINSWVEAKKKFIIFKDRTCNGDYIEEIAKLDNNPDNLVAKNKIKSQIPVYIQGKFPVNILLLGHPYNVYENYINIDMVERLKSMDCHVFTIEKMEDSIFTESIKIGNNYQQYWQTEDEILKTAQYYIKAGKKEIDGVIFLISFACGPDSLIQEIIMRDMKENKIPYLTLILDEHSGESGMVTRIQALIEMIRRKKYQNDDYK